METSSKKSRETSISSSTSDIIRSGISTHSNTNNINMASTSGTHTQSQQPEAPHSSDDDIFFGRTTRLMWKAQTEQAAASHQSPKWNEPDTDYTPPVKKAKKERHRDVDVSSSAHSTKEPREYKKKKSLASSKPPKTPKSAKHAIDGNTSHRSKDHANSHSTPSQAKATAPPPSTSSQQQEVQKQPKDEELVESDMLHGAQLDAKTMNALHAIREAATTSAQAAAIQDAITSVLSQSSPQPSKPAPFVASSSYAATLNLTAPVPVYPAAQAPPPPPPPNVMLANSEMGADQRHCTFMIPPTDPLYNMIVSYYFEIKKYYNMSKAGDPEIINQLRMEIENEKCRKNDLNEGVTSTTNQIEELLASGVQTLKDRLDKLGMHSVTDVTELLAGSKQIVTQHKGLTTNVSHMENSVAIEEQKLRALGGPDALRCFEESLSQPVLDIAKLSDLVISCRGPNYVPLILPEDSPSTDSKVSPSSRRPRQPRPRQTPSSGGKRANSTGRKSDGNQEEVELEIRQFVQHALKVDNAVKEKERKARGKAESPSYSSSSLQCYPCFDHN